MLLEYAEIPFFETPVSDQGVDIDQMVETEEVALSHLARIGKQIAPISVIERKLLKAALLRIRRERRAV